MKTIYQLKGEARDLVKAEREKGNDIKLGHTLDMLARREGFKDWNTFHGMRAKDEAAQGITAGHGVAARRRAEQASRRKPV